MATASGDAAVKIWSVTDYTCLKTFDGHDASVLKVCFCSAGMQLLSTGKAPPPSSTLAALNSPIAKYIVPFKYIIVSSISPQAS